MRLKIRFWVFLFLGFFTNITFANQIDENGNPVSIAPKTVKQMLAEIDALPPPKCAGIINLDASCDVKLAPASYTGEPQNTLKPGDVLIINRYRVVVTEVKAEGGNVFSGQGLASMPFLGPEAKLPVKIMSVAVLKEANDPTGGGRFAVAAVWCRARWWCRAAKRVS